MMPSKPGWHVAFRRSRRFSAASSTFSVARLMISSIWSGENGFAT
jgi:hypothetical protein